MKRDEISPLWTNCHEIWYFGEPVIFHIAPSGQNINLSYILFLSTNICKTTDTPVTPVVYCRPNFTSYPMHVYIVSSVALTFKLAWL